MNCEFWNGYVNSLYYYVESIKSSYTVTVTEQCLILSKFVITRVRIYGHIYFDW